MSLLACPTLKNQINATIATIIYVFENINTIRSQSLKSKQNNKNNNFIYFIKLQFCTISRELYLF